MAIQTSQLAITGAGITRPKKLLLGTASHGVVYGTTPQTIIRRILKWISPSLNECNQSGFKDRKATQTTHRPTTNFVPLISRGARRRSATSVTRHLISIEITTCQNTRRIRNIKDTVCTSTRQVPLLKEGGAEACTFNNEYRGPGTGWPRILASVSVRWSETSFFSAY